MYWPSILPGIEIVALVAAIAAGLHFVLRRRASYERLRKHNDVAGFLFSVVGVIYAVVLGFIVVVAWEKYDTAVLTTENEVAAVSDLYRGVVSFPAQDRTRIRRLLHEYVDVVTRTEWPAMSQGKAPTAGIRVVEWVAYYVGKYEPQTRAQQDAHVQALDQVQRLFDARRLRVHESEESIPGVLWFALFVGGVSTIGFAFLFGVENQASQLLMTAILAGVIAVLFVVISQFDHPFQGAVNVSPSSWYTLHDRFELIH